MSGVPGGGRPRAGDTAGGGRGAAERRAARRDAGLALDPTGARFGVGGSPSAWLYDVGVGRRRPGDAAVEATRRDDALGFARAVAAVAARGHRCSVGWADTTIVLDPAPLQAAAGGAAADVDAARDAIVGAALHGVARLRFLAPQLDAAGRAAAEAAGRDADEAAFCAVATTLLGERAAEAALLAEAPGFAGYLAAAWRARFPDADLATRIAAAGEEWSGASALELLAALAARYDRPGASVADALAALPAGHRLLLARGLRLFRAAERGGRTPALLVGLALRLTALFADGTVPDWAALARTMAGDDDADGDRTDGDRDDRDTGDDAAGKGHDGDDDEVWARAAWAEEWRIDGPTSGASARPGVGGTLAGCLLLSGVVVDHARRVAPAGETWTAADAARARAEGAARARRVGRVNTSALIPGHPSGARTWSVGAATRPLPIVRHFPHADARAATIYARDLAAVRGGVAALSRVLRVRTERRSEKSRALVRGRLDEGRLADVPFVDAEPGLPRLFTRDRTEREPLVGIGLLIDESGSMHEGVGGGLTRIDLVRRATVQLDAALRALRRLDPNGVQWLIRGHTGDEQGQVGVSLRHYLDGGDEDPRVLGGITARQQNYDGPALAQIVAEMERRWRDGRERVLFVLSDGVPAAHQYGGPPAIAQQAWQVAGARRRGTEVIHLYLGPADGQSLAALTTMYGPVGRGTILAPTPLAVPGLLGTLLRRRLARRR